MPSVLPSRSKRKLYVGQVDDEVLLPEFRAMFEKFGTIEGAFLIGDGTVRRGFGFVTFGASIEHVHILVHLLTSSRAHTLR